MSKSDDKYFSMSKAVEEFKHESFGPGEKALAGLKIIGKGLFNTVKFTSAEIIPSITSQAEKASERAAKNQKK